MRLSSTTENERPATPATTAATQTTASTQTDGSSTVVIPYNAPTESTFEQALTQATTPESATATPAQQATGATVQPAPSATTGVSTTPTAGLPTIPGYGYYMLPGYYPGATGAQAATPGGTASMMPVAMVPVAFMMMPVASAGMYGAMPMIPAAAQSAGGTTPATGTPGAATAAATAPTTTGMGGGSAALQMPFNGQVDITQGFGPTSFSAEPPYEGYAHFHTGIDFGVPSGTPIDAAGGGTVVAAGWDNTGYGNRVIIDHGNGLETLYGHLERVDVTPGMQVAAGQQIGLSGSTGNSTGPHLHFGVELHGTWVDPTPYLQSGGSTTPLAQPASQPTMQTPVAGGDTGIGGAYESGDGKDMGGGAVSTAPAAFVSSPSSPTYLMEGTTDGNPPRYGVVFAAVPVQAAAVTPERSAQTEATATVPQQAPEPIFTVATAPPIVTPPQTTQASMVTPIRATGAPAPVPATAATGGGIVDLVQQASAATGVPASLIKAVMQAESSGNPNAVSPSGAKGLMQLMDGTAANYGVKDPFDPRQNLLGGARFLRDLLQQFQGNMTLAVAAYNAGPGAVTRYGGVPPYPETKAYVARVLQLQQQYAAQGG